MNKKHKKKNKIHNQMTKNFKIKSKEVEIIRKNRQKELL
jgi:hypothetical protein